MRKILDFWIHSTLLAIWLTGPPVALLVLIVEFGLIKPFYMILWLLLTLFWTFYNLFRYVEKSMKIKEAKVLVRMKNKELFAGKNNKKGTIITKMPLKNIEKSRIPITYIELSKNIICPYCCSRFKDEEELNIHIDRIHIGSGLLEGDVRQW
jgi:hypothetical protein